MKNLRKRAEVARAKKTKEMLRALKSINGLYDMIAYLITFKLKEILFLIILAILTFHYYPEIFELLKF